MKRGKARFSIDMQDLKDLKSRFFENRFCRREGENLVNPIILEILIQTMSDREGQARAIR